MPIRRQERKFIAPRKRVPKPTPQGQEELKQREVRVERRKKRKTKKPSVDRRWVKELYGSHEGEDIVVVGTGTSLANIDWTKFNSKVCIALNDAVLVEGFKPHFHIFCDTGIYTRYWNHPMDPRTKVISQQRPRQMFLEHKECKFGDQTYEFVHSSQAKKCKTDDNELFVGRTVATGAIMLAWKLGARRVFLCGVDAYKKQGPEGGVYYHDGRGKGIEQRKQHVEPDGLVMQDRHDFWVKQMVELRGWFDKHGVYQDPWPGSNVYNCSEHSKVEAWEKVGIRKVIRSR